MFAFLHRRRFREIVRTQLLLFDEDQAELLRDARAALAAYNSADREDAETAWSRYDDLTEDLEEALLDMCDRYGSHVDEARAAHYRREFRRQALIRFRDVLPHTAYGDWDS